MVKAIVDIIGGSRPCIGLDVIASVHPPLDILTGTGYDVLPINGAESAKDRRGQDVYDRSGRLKIRNMRAAVYWHLREMLEADEIDLPPTRICGQG